ncbi:MAG: nicotinate (nicotinamide) nucleotide adenylyltransferase [Minicystis sp.]
MAGRKRVAVFGGSFNPPHVAHLLAAVYALSTAPIDEVLVVPVYRHPFSKSLLDFDHRLTMCRLALAWVPRVTVSAVERELGGESLTLRLVEHLAEEHADWSLRLLIGADVLADLPKWHRFDRIAEVAPPLVLGRVGVVPPPDAGLAIGRAGAIPMPSFPALPRVSSTEIRASVAAGQIEAVRDRLPAAVLAYILEHGLYRAGDESGGEP